MTGITSGVPIRIPAADFLPSASQRKIMHRHRDCLVRVFARFSDCPDAQGHDDIARAWLVARHGHFPQDCASLTAMPTPFMAIGDAKGAPLAGVFFDENAHMLSARLFYFDVARARHSPGTFAVLSLIRHAQDTARAHVHLGKWNADPHQRTAYKTNYRPCEYLHGGVWRPLIRL